MNNPKPKLLFLCTGNSCRSQMAEGWAKKLRGHEYEAYSAGTQPQGLNQLAVKVMQEVDVDLSGNRSKHIDQLKDITWDLVITVCDSARESCPVIPGDVRTLHHSFDDPPHLAKDCKSEAEALVHYRRVRDEIYEFIKSSDFF